MKKIGLLLVGLFAVLTLGMFSSCGPDEDAVPAVAKVTKSNSFGIAGKVTTLSVDITATNDLKSIKVTPTEGTGVIVASTEVDAAGVFSKDLLKSVVKYDYTPVAASAGKYVKFTIDVTDKEKTASFKDSLFVTELKVKENVSMNWISTDGNAMNVFDVKTGTVIKANEATADKGDIFYITQTAQKNCLVPTNSTITKEIYGINSVTYDNTTKRATKLSKSTAVFATADANTINGLTPTEEKMTGTTYLGVNQLAVGNVLAFETKDGQKGLISVKTVATVAKDLKVNYTMTFDIKYLANKIPTAAK